VVLDVLRNMVLLSAEHQQLLYPDAAAYLEECNVQG
jgi:hypothetical protein